jgi:alpha-glucosidase
MLAGMPAVAKAQPAGEVFTAASPGNILSVSVTVNGEGRPEYSVSRLGRPVIAPSRLGFLLTDAAKLERNFVITADAPTLHDDSWEQPWGERRFIRNHYTLFRVHFTERNGLQRRMAVVFRLYDDGLGFRYEIPDQPNLKTVNIGD